MERLDSVKTVGEISKLWDKYIDYPLRENEILIGVEEFKQRKGMEYTLYKGKIQDILKHKKFVKNTFSIHGNLSSKVKRQYSKLSLCFKIKKVMETVSSEDLDYIDVYYIY
jgi:hypothetical protein